MNTHASARDFQWTITTGLTAHLMALAHFVQKSSMERLSRDNRYGRLSLGFEGFMSLLAVEDLSPGDLARALNISKQACSKTLGELASLGLVARRPNPRDNRSRLLSLTDKGRQLLRDGHRVTTEIQHQLADTVGQDRLLAVVESLDKLCRVLAIDLSPYRTLDTLRERPGGTLNLLLLKLSNHCYQALIESLGRQGFEGLKPNFSQVLSLVIPDGGRIQHIARVVGVSKQAIAAIASELEQLDYIRRDPDPDDGRQVILRLTPQGEHLLASSRASVTALEASFRGILGDEAFGILEDTLAALHIEVAGHLDTEQVSASRIRQLCQQLLLELGDGGARALAHQLLLSTKGDS